MYERNLERLKSISEVIGHVEIDALFISDPSSIHYYLGIDIIPMERLYLLLLRPNGRHILLANELFQISLPDALLAQVDLILTNDNDIFLSVIENHKLLPERGQVIGVDALFPSGKLLPLMKRYSSLSFVLAGNLIDQQRAHKNEEDMALMRQASAINDRAMARMISEVLPYAPTEIEACERLAKIYVEEGADGGFSFEPIVAYGANGADPHHLSDQSRPQIGDAIIIDIGCRYQGYCSDMTRTVYFGEASDHQREIYEICREAQALGIQAASRPLASFAQVDRACRLHINKAGYGPNFIHRTGHHIGLDAHEKGDVSAMNHQVIEVGHCFSIEPGIYLSGDTAVRIEDLVMKTQDGLEVINHYPKDLIIITPK